MDLPDFGKWAQVLDAKQTRPSPVLERVWLHETTYIHGLAASAAPRRAASLELGSILAARRVSCAVECSQIVTSAAPRRVAVRRIVNRALGADKTVMLNFSIKRLFVREDLSPEMRQQSAQRRKEKSENGISTRVQDSQRSYKSSVSICEDASSGAVNQQ